VSPAGGDALRADAAALLAQIAALSARLDRPPPSAVAVDALYTATWRLMDPWHWASLDLRSPSPR
jgi:hypothetical protein